MRIQLHRSSRHALLLTAVVLAVGFPSSARADEKPHRFEADIQKFEAQDRQAPPPEAPILFIGSSTIRLWKLEQSFPRYPVMNRGFGGSHIADSVYYADRIVIPYKPRAIVFYAGDNDLAGGRSPEAVADDFRQFITKVHAALPRTPIVYISIKPSPSRWKIVDKGRDVNRRIEAMTRDNALLSFVDITGVMLDAEGKPRADLFVADGLHMNGKGYELWTSILSPVIEKLARPAD